MLRSDNTSGVLGGADLIVMVVLRFENHDDFRGVLCNTARFASSEACDRCAVNPCLAAMARESFKSLQCTLLCEWASIG